MKAIDQLNLSDAIAKQSIERRWCCVQIDPQFLLDMLKVPPEGLYVGGDHVTVTENAIPMDAKALRVGIGDRGEVVLVIESPSLPAMHLGAELKCLNPKYRSQKPVAFEE